MKGFVVIFSVLLGAVLALCWQPWAAVAAPDLEVGAGPRVEAAPDVVGAEGDRDEPGNEEQALQRTPEESWQIATLVRDALDDGVEGARIEVRSAPGGALVAEAVAGPRGVVRFDVRGEEVYVRARDPDLGGSLEHRLTRKRRSCVMVLRRPVWMRGYALDTAGQPLVGARVVLSRGGDFSMRQLFGGGSDVPAMPSRMRTDEQGAFAFEAPAGWSGVATLEIPAEDGIPDTSATPFTVRDGGEVLVGPPGTFCVRGVVVGRTGKEVEAVVVQADLPYTRLPNQARTFSAALQPGRPTRFVAFAEAGEGVVDVVATRANPQPRVVIRIGDGKRVPVLRSLGKDRVDVEATLPDGGAPPALRYRWVDETFTRSLGELEREKGASFQLHSVPSPPARLWVKARSGEVATWVLPGGILPKRVALRLQKPVDVEVEVLHQGRPARGLTATLYACGTRETIKMGRRGTARFTRVCPGPAKLVVKRGWEVVGEQRLFLADAGTTRATVPVDLSR